MSKIHETLNVIKSGARTNKYRVLYPVFGRDLDIVCNATSVPGREISTVEAYVKGRKYQLAGDMADDGTWEMTIYNTPDLLHRRFFLKMLGGVQNFNNPDYLENPGVVAPSTLNDGTNLGLNTSGASTTLLGDLFSNVSAATSAINSAYYDIKATFNAVERTSNDIRNAINGDLNSFSALISISGYSARPWYMQDIVIQQLDGNGSVITSATLYNCFVTSVGALEYSDETPEISTSTITFAYSGIEYGSGSELPSIEIY